MDCTTVAWSCWADSIALWQKTPVTWTHFFPSADYKDPPRHQPNRIPNTSSIKINKCSLTKSWTLSCGEWICLTNWFWPASKHLLIYNVFVSSRGFVSFCANLATASAANLLQLGMQTAGCPNTFIHTKKFTTRMPYSDFCLDFASQRVPKHWQSEQVQGTHAQRNANCPWTEKKTCCTSPKMIRHT